MQEIIHGRLAPVAGKLKPFIVTTKVTLRYEPENGESSFGFPDQGDEEHHDRYHFQPPDPHNPDKNPF
jgi:hypothetical protein